MHIFSHSKNSVPNLTGHFYCNKHNVLYAYSAIYSHISQCTMIHIHCSNLM
uniref:Uncharacterized protein n=1 Tax=Anguilla anguilla TaxID=7936 RepID=A0A0E9SD05_ANGAN